MVKRIDRPAFVFGLVLLSATGIAAQGVILTSPGFGPPPQMAGPPRDQQSTAAAGSAIIRGRVVAADSGRPLRRAQIRVSAAELGPNGRSTSTNLDGRYELKDCPAGRYTVQVMRSGYLPLQYGQRRPLEQGQPLQLADKQVVENVNFALPKASVVSGRITDELGEPVAGALVYAMRSTYWQGRRRLTPAGFSPPTDDLGQYRITGLMPGSYFVMATLRDTWTVSEKGDETTFGYAQTYYPGTAGTANARKVTVSVGQEASTTDFTLIPGRAATISGRALDSHGLPLAGRSVGLLQELAGPSNVMMMIASNTMVAADGTFTIRNVSPGEYMLRSPTPGPGMASSEVATMRVMMDGVDMADVTLMARAGWSISGRVTVDTAASAAPPARDRIRLAARLVDGDTGPTPGPPMGAQTGESGRVRDDWTFSVTNVFGPARLRVTVPDGWTVKSILRDGVDVSDAPLEMKSGEELTNVEVVVTDRVSTVSGQITGAQGPVADGTVLVFAEDEDKWAEDSRWVRTARPDQQGQYQIKGLPPGRYLAAALDYVEDGLWNDPEFLRSIEAQAQRFILMDAGSQVLPLKMITP